MEKSLINIASLEKAIVSDAPFPHIVVSEFLNMEHAVTIQQDFPRVNFPGSVPLTDVQYGPLFGKLLEELEGEVLRKAIEQKFEIDLANRPTLITVRGKTRARDGKIHTDTKSKLITLLLYFNSEWPHNGGRLRILRNRENLDDYVREISPLFGTCLIFKVTENCWHGHQPFEGERRAIQLNYLSGQAALKQHLSKHHMSARLKTLKRWFAREDEY